jgi:hypothetical protein
MTESTKISATGQTVKSVESSTGTVHSYSLEEQKGIVEHLNAALAADPDLKSGALPFARTPVDPESDDFYTAIRDGVLLR